MEKHSGKSEGMKKILPPTYFYLSIVAIALLRLFFPVAKIPKSYVMVVAGLFLIIAGAILNIWADWLFKKNETAVKPMDHPSALIKKGPFRVSRNPMYLGMLLILVGIAFLLGSASPFIAPVIFFAVINFWIIPGEEDIMSKVFKDKYLDYKKSVRRWI